MNGVAVVILAGGEGKRIGGKKPLRLLGGKRLIDTALELARGWSKTVAVAVRYGAQIGSIDAAIIEDEAIDGPIGGLAAGLNFARTRGCSFLLTIPADMPFLPADLVDRLTAAVGQSGGAVASSGGHRHPVCALWRVSAVDRVDDYVADGGRSLKGFAALVGAAEVDWPTDGDDPFFNINSADDLAEAEKRLS